IYATNKAKPSFRRMITYTTEYDSESKHQLPIFVHYVITKENVDDVQKMQNAQQVISPTQTVRDRTQIYNSRRQLTIPLEEQYRSIMKSLQDENSIVSHLSMSRQQAPIVILDYEHQMKELLRNCINLNQTESKSILCLDTTFNLGKFFVTPTTFQHIALERRQQVLSTVFDEPESIIESETNEIFDERLSEMKPKWDEILPSFSVWFDRYQSKTFRNHMISSVRLQAGHMSSGHPRLFYNNDCEATLNHALKNETNWNQRPLTDIVDLIGKAAIAQKNEIIRSFYGLGDFELVGSYAR
ncbi:unnamed protein product, partial [Didymodactylos carnosus]